MINKLIALASQLDSMGQHNAADDVDNLAIALNNKDNKFDDIKILEYLMKSLYGLDFIRNLISQDIELYEKYKDDGVLSGLTETLMRDCNLEIQDLPKVVSAIDNYYSDAPTLTVRDPYENPLGKSITERLIETINSNQKFADEYSRLDNSGKKREAFENLTQKDEAYIKQLIRSGFEPYDIYSFYRDILNVEYGLERSLDKETGWAKPAIEALSPVLEDGSKVES